MTDHKFTDDEIIKMLEEIPEVGDCSRDCIFYDGKVHHCASVVAYHALDLINRQKASLQDVITLNSKLEAENAKLQRLLDFYEETSGNKKAKAEAIKEFAKKLKAETIETDRWGKIVLISDINTLVKEMTEVEK